MSKNINVVWCLNYNGVYVVSDDLTSAEVNSLNDKCDDVASLTYDLVGGDIFDQVNEGEMDSDEIEVTDDMIAQIKAAVQQRVGEDYVVCNVVLNYTDT